LNHAQRTSTRDDFRRPSLNSQPHVTPQQREDGSTSMKAAAAYFSKARGVLTGRTECQTDLTLFPFSAQELLPVFVSSAYKTLV
jgi:hypothetical protein